MKDRIYYLRDLLKKSLSFTNEEKKEIFEYIKEKKDNKNEIERLISIFEEEQKGFEKIKENYHKKVEEIGEEYQREMKEKNLEEYNTKNKTRGKIKYIQSQEIEEKENERKKADELLGDL